MGSHIDLTAKDGFTLTAYRAEPEGAARGGVVVLQEIFGVNHHIRGVTDRFATEGYLAIAPAVFDRVETNIEFGYDGNGMTRGRDLANKLQPETTLADIEAAIQAAAPGGKVGIVGYCWGGTFAFAAACRLPGLAAAVGYYGGNILQLKDEKPRIPTMLHFGAHDTHIPMSAVDAIRAARPEVPVHVYEAGHGFNCDERESYDRESADVARQLTLQFFGKHLAAASPTIETGAKDG